MTFNSRTGVFSQAFNSAALSANDVWKRNSISGWTSDSSSSDYGIWSGNVTVNSYLVSSTPNGNYGDVYLGNFQAAANLPAANPTANAFRIYLATDSGTAPVKPYLEQRPTHVGGPNPPLVGQTTTVAVSIAITNPTTQPITFSAANLVTANIPGGGAVYAGSPQVTQGALVSQPTIGGTGNITWNPGTLAAGALASLSYYVDATHRTITDNGGRYLFENVAVDGFYTITPTRANYQFNPSSRAFSLLGDMTEAVFTGTQTGDNQNPLDN
ncbi:MAG TPA: hypothetical protein VJ124_20430 [Pyrinomonadaceae bacterium]|nr:hypothetical protein [Pyrinomonadaceae bacterium]